MNVLQTSSLDFGLEGPLKFIIKKWCCQSKAHPVEKEKETKTEKNVSVCGCRQVFRKQDTEEIKQDKDTVRNFNNPCRAGRERLGCV